MALRADEGKEEKKRNIRVIHTASLLLVWCVDRETNWISLLALPAVSQAGGGKEKGETDIPAWVSGQVSALILQGDDTCRSWCQNPLVNVKLGEEGHEAGQTDNTCTHVLSGGQALCPPCSKWQGSALSCAPGTGRISGAGASREMDFPWKNFRKN